jgi:hypothetical protein
VTTRLVGAVVAAGLLAAAPAQLAGQGAAPPLAPAPATAQDLEAPRFGRWGFDLEGRDLTVRPGDNFHRYANGRYLDALQIPADRAAWGGPYSLLNDLNDRRIRTLVEASAAATPGRSACSMRASWMNSVSRHLACARFSRALQRFGPPAAIPTTPPSWGDRWPISAAPFSNSCSTRIGQTRRSTRFT